MWGKNLQLLLKARDGAGGLWWSRFQCPRTALDFHFLPNKNYTSFHKLRKSLHFLNSVIFTYD